MVDVSTSLIESGVLPTEVPSMTTSAPEGAETIRSVGVAGAAGSELAAAADAEAAPAASTFAGGLCLPALRGLSARRLGLGDRRSSGLRAGLARAC